ncbi:ImmA/IrrE family metallo-endopeptidase [Enterococcus lemanii]|uniref:ImmA/IrrE family metallo-endopeptidase n=1 Tax=Enterococcus lemanii TaxID=1159752 RepID=A0ABV9MUS6_9ENTE|nr:ImmA/IrrE family metallo-endopeptidase [Enterococcus lemanii]MBM7710042.1 Zn-dependent peptidase ImmA (M78 family) [Enterococcus lemanii]
MNNSLQNEIHRVAREQAILFLSEFSVTDFIGPTIESIIELKRIHLIYDTIDDWEAEGFSASKQGLNFIFINSNFNLRLQKFTIAHEIYHLDDKIEQLASAVEAERAADHFAANILLPENVVFEKYRSLKRSGYNSLEVFFALADLSQVPYEAMYKRYKELEISTVDIDKNLKLIQIESRNPYLKTLEQELQLLRKNVLLSLSELDQPTYKKAFRKLENLKNHFEQQRMVADSE